MLRSLTSPSLSRPTPYTDYFSFVNKNINIFQLPMENNSNSKDMKDDQQRKGYCKEAAAGDYNSSKRASDYILPHLLNLYASRATRQDFEIYAPNATFEDPLMRAHGVKQIKSSFYSLNKVFSESRIVEYSITEKEISPGNTEILIDSKQYYKFLGKDIHMISLIKLYTEGGKVVRHEDCWDKKPLRDRETVKVPLVGRMLETSRRASMFLTHALMGFGKDPTM
ncbi:uncharacterized protein [Nicotiana sylvestris]|uniref:Uncharacterized protein LOC104216490 n=1 Tax=Nicotiana sylvestris TaxID=4096 RepID=A0A1U7VIU3_NICSY|nr:PREDICTED: uncharacterized protein LOC104216490 [Nicotiana sylvestris]